MSRIKIENLSEKEVKGSATVESVEKMDASELRRQVRARGCSEATPAFIRVVRG